MIVCNVAALQTAAQHGVAAPALLGYDANGEAAGVIASIEMTVPGTSVWRSPTTSERLRAGGRAVAATHRVRISPMEALPYRARPIAVDDFARERRLGRMPTTALLRRADELVRATKPAIGCSVFLHGDVWPGNMVWSTDDVATLIDWKTAGVGNPGVDLAELRKQVMIAFGAGAPKYVLRGWEETIGLRASDLPYWDCVAALNTQTTLENETMTNRRDVFLRMALSEMS